MSVGENKHIILVRAIMAGIKKCCSRAVGAGGETTPRHEEKAITVQEFLVKNYFFVT